MKMTLGVNTDICVGCYACEVACKQEHNLPVGPRLIRVYADGPQQIDGKQQLKYKVAFCLHCDHPACMESCPIKAISVNEDGIAIINAELCNGCKKCIAACPYGVMQFDEITKTALKCDLCINRLSKGTKPACVTACPCHCIHYGSKSEVKRKLGKVRQAEMKI
jgi:Fe-S-cluster-containing dehydrogenase component